MMKCITRLVVELLVRLRPTKNEIDFKHYPILNDRLAFLPNYFNIPYAVHSSNLPQVNIRQEMHYLCGSDIENLKGSVLKNSVARSLRIRFDSLYTSQDKSRLEK